VSASVISKDHSSSLPSISRDTRMDQPTAVRILAFAAPRDCIKPLKSPGRETILIANIYTASLRLPKHVISVRVLRTQLPFSLSSLRIRFFFAASVIRSAGTSGPGGLPSIEIFAPVQNLACESGGNTQHRPCCVVV